MNWNCLHGCPIWPQIVLYYHQMGDQWARWAKMNRKLVPFGVNVAEFRVEIWPTDCPQLHIVHYNTKYADIGAAVGNSDGLAVLGYMFEVRPAYGYIYNSNLIYIISTLQNLILMYSVFHIFFKLPPPTYSNIIVFYVYAIYQLSYCNLDFLLSSCL